MNKVVLIGRLTADPEVRTASDKTVANYTLAVDRKGAKGATGQSADFIRCVAWEKRAEFADKYLKKGTKIAIIGRIQTGTYKDRDGKTVYTTDVVVEEQEFCEKKSQADETEETKSSIPEATEDFVPVPADFEGLPFN